MHFSPLSEISMKIPGGAELLVLAGTLSDQNDKLIKYSWLRIPVEGELNAKAGPEGAKIWIKTGYLTDVDKQIERVEKAE